MALDIETNNTTATATTGAFLSTVQNGGSINDLIDGTIQSSFNGVAAADPIDYFKFTYPATLVRVKVDYSYLFLPSTNILSKAGVSGVTDHVEISAAAGFSGPSLILESRVGSAAYGTEGAQLMQNIANLQQSMLNTYLQKSAQGIDDVSLNIDIGRAAQIGGIFAKIFEGDGVNADPAAVKSQLTSTLAGYTSGSGSLSQLVSIGHQMEAVAAKWTNPLYYQDSGAGLQLVSGFGVGEPSVLWTTSGGAGSGFLAVTGYTGYFDQAGGAHTAALSYHGGIAVQTETGASLNKPDLSFTSMKINASSLAANGDFRVDYTIANNGQVNAPASQIGLYVSDTATFSKATAALLFNFDTGAHAPNTSGGEALAFNLNSSIAPGQHYIFLYADNTNLIDEVSETNNVSAGAALTITSAAPTTVQTTSADYKMPIDVDNVTITNGGTHQVVGNTLGNIILGNTGNDTIFAGAGHDTVRGGDGNDTIVGNADIFAKESDVLDGGNGNDIIYGEYTDTINGGPGFDILYAVNAYDWSIDLGATGIELFIADFGNDTITAATQTVGVEVVASGGNDTVTGSPFNDRLWAGVGNDVMHGGAGDDMLFGDVGADQLYGDAGNDILYVDAADTVVDGGAGYDIVYITTGTGMTINMAAQGIEFVIDQAGGTNVINAAGMTVGANIYTGGGNDTITGSSLDDVLWGLGGNDSIVGGLGNDVLVGGTGADVLTPGPGTDRVYLNSGGGGDGAVDRVVFAAGWGKDTVYDFQHGSDKLDLTALHTTFGALSITSAGGSAVITLGADQIVVNGLAGTMTANDFLF